MKKLSLILVTLLVLTMIAAGASFSVSAAEITTSGSCGNFGNNVVFVYDEATETLTLSGEGETEMIPFMVPWNKKGYPKLSKLVIEEGVTSIGDDLFGTCKDLVNVSLPSTLTSIGTRAFQDCTSLSEITLPSGLTSLGEDAFSRCTSLENLNIPSGVSVLPAGIFDGCSNLKNVTLGNGITSIENDAFTGCAKLASITLPNGVTEIGDKAFSGCEALASVTLPTGLKAIGDEAYAYCTKIESIVIPSGVTTIGDSAFYACTSLSEIKIPVSVTEIGYNAFSTYAEAVTISFAGTEAAWNAMENTDEYKDGYTISFGGADNSDADDSQTAPTEPIAQPDSEKKSSGCGSSITLGAGFSLLVLLASMVMVIGKRKIVE